MLMPLMLGLILGGAQDPDPYLKKEITIKEEVRQDLSGQAHSIPARGNKGTVLLFLTSSCPIGNKLLPEIKRIEQSFSTKGLKFLFVYPEAALEVIDAKAHLAEFRVPIPAVFDKDHSLTKALGITVTPEVALLTPGGKLLYRGRVNDLFFAHGKQRSEPKTHDLRGALKDFLDGKLQKPRYTEAIGCYIQP